MAKIDLQQDAELFRTELALFIERFAAEHDPPSAIEVGYEISQGGWIFIHPDLRPKHERDGEWTLDVDYEAEGCIRYAHWIDALEAHFDGDALTVQRYDGTSFVCELDEEEVDEDEDLAVAIGKMIHAVLMASKKAGVFDRPGWAGNVQLDIEDFDGVWGWPEFDDLGKANLV